MKNISKFILTFFIAVPLVFAFGTQTVKRIDEIKNNTGTDIVLNPTDSVKINYFDGSKVLQSSPYGDLTESAVTNTELSFVSGVTSSIQTQINAKQDALTGVDGDLYYYNSGLSNLAIGTNGQILQVSALGFPEWVDLPPAVSVTTKGDLQTYSTSPDRLPLGTDGQVLQANSATSTGLEWVDADFYTSPLTTEGDILYRDATQDTRLPIGTEGQVLTVNASGFPTWSDNVVDTNAATICNAGEYLDGDGTCNTLPSGSTFSKTLLASAEINSSVSTSTVTHINNVNYSVPTGGYLVVDIQILNLTSLATYGVTSASTCNNGTSFWNNVQSSIIIEVLKSSSSGDNSENYDASGCKTTAINYFEFTNPFTGVTLRQCQANCSAHSGSTIHLKDDNNDGIVTLRVQTVPNKSTQFTSASGTSRFRYNTRA